MPDLVTAPHNVAAPFIEISAVFKRVKTHAFNLSVEREENTIIKMF